MGFASMLTLALVCGVSTYLQGMVHPVGCWLMCVSFAVPGGSVEAVLIPMLHRRGSRKHITLCVSSQVGCAMNCQFCYTGRMGLSGNLSTAQIVEQVGSCAYRAY